MKRVLASILLTVMSFSFLQASETRRDFPRITFGAEGNFILTAATWRHFNYVADAGYRVNIKGYDYSPVFNGQILANIGCNISGRVNLSLYSGYGGIYRKKTAVPLMLRVTYFWGKDPLAHRWFSCADTGVVTDGLEFSTAAPCGRLGGGYRLSLSRSVKLDFLVTYQRLSDHPEVTELVDGTETPVTGGRLRRSDVLINAVTFGIALNF